MRETMLKRYLFMGLGMSMTMLTLYRCLHDSTAEGKTREETVAKKSNPRPRLQPAAENAVSVTLNGTIVRKGERFALRETSGALYALDSTGRAWPFEGEDVKVIGHMDRLASFIHIDRIDSIESESAA
jgi:hypothetical protein